MGTYGQVYLAKYIGSTNFVAIKCMLKSKLSRRAQDNLVSEISILKALKHPHIVQMLDFTWDSTYVYIIMDYCAGGDLSRYLRKHKYLKESLVQHFLQQLALALQYLKETNVVHMDLKPQNILLTSTVNPVLKVTDFGFAQQIESTIQMNEVRGTLLYMAPEVYCEGVYHPSCDLWSVGIIMYECLFAQTPYGSTNVEQLKEKLLSIESIEIPTYISISNSCRNLLLGLLKRDPKKRFNHDQFFAHPFVDLEHVPSPDSLNQSIIYLEKASKLESLTKLKEAYDCYVQGLYYLYAASKYETSPKRKVELNHLLRGYLNKTEHLKTALSLNRPTKPRPPSIDTSLKRYPPDRPHTPCPTKLPDLERNDSQASSDLTSGCSGKQPTTDTTNLSIHSSTGMFTRFKQWVCSAGSIFSADVNSSHALNNYVSTAHDDHSTSTNMLLELPPVHESKNTVEQSIRAVEACIEPSLLPVCASIPSSNLPNSNQVSLTKRFSKLNQNLKDLIDEDVDDDNGNGNSELTTQTKTSAPTQSALIERLKTFRSLKYLSENAEDESHPLMNSVSTNSSLPSPHINNPSVNSRQSKLPPPGIDPNVSSFLGTFYHLIDANELEKAYIHFETEFAGCLKIVKDDSDKNRRVYLLNQLNNAMDRAEKIKLKLNQFAPDLENSAESFELGQKLADVPHFQADEHEGDCVLM